MLMISVSRIKGNEFNSHFNSLYYVSFELKAPTSAIKYHNKQTEKSFKVKPQKKSSITKNFCIKFVHVTIIRGKLTTILIAEEVFKEDTTLVAVVRETC